MPWTRLDRRSPGRLRRRGNDGGDRAHDRLHRGIRMARSTRSTGRVREASPSRTGEHILYSVLTLVIAGVIALPIGSPDRAHREAAGLAIGVSGALRATPDARPGRLSWRLDLANISIVPPLIALTILAIPPLLAGAYCRRGVRESQHHRRGASDRDDRVADPRARSSCRSALPLVLGGLRSGALQVIATWTVAAILPVGGLGRFLFDGLSVQNYPRCWAARSRRRPSPGGRRSVRHHAEARRPARSHRREGQRRTREEPVACPRNHRSRTSAHSLTRAHPCTHTDPPHTEERESHVRIQEEAASRPACSQRGRFSPSAHARRAEAAHSAPTAAPRPATPSRSARPPSASRRS